MRLSWNPEPSAYRDRGLRFWVLFNGLRLCWFCSGTWLWSTVPVASDQTRNRKPLPRRSYSPCLASLISDARRLPVPVSRGATGAKQGSVRSALIAVVSLKYPMGFAEVFRGISLMGSGHVWSWMWFWANRREWKGTQTDRVKCSRVEGLMQRTALARLKPPT